MARTQADAYEDRRKGIRDKAADLFAERGFHGASIADLAEACGTSKSLFYHYYASKEDILYDVMHDHVQALLDTAERVWVEPAPARERLRTLTLCFMEQYLGAASRQRVLVNEMRHLPAAERKTVTGIQRRLVEIVDGLIVEARPELKGAPALRRPAAMLYFGMINWMHTWLDPDGAAEPRRIAELAVNTYLDGIVRGEIPA